MNDLEKMAEWFLQCVDAERKAREERIDAEMMIAKELQTKDEGTDKAVAGCFAITVTSKLTRTLDYEAYREIEDSLPEGVRCVDMKPAINLKKLRALEMVDPKLPSLFITTKPAKASVKIEFQEAA